MRPTSLLDSQSRDSTPPQPISASSPPRTHPMQMGRKVCTHPHWLCFPKTQPSACYPHPELLSGRTRESSAQPVVFAGTANPAYNSQGRRRRSRSFSRVDYSTNHRQYGPGGSFWFLNQQPRHFQQLHLVSAGEALREKN